MAKLKYSEEEKSELYDKYLECETDEAREQYIENYVATHEGRSKRSVISILSGMGIYKTKIRVSKITGGIPETKASLVKRIEKKYSLVGLEGLDKAPKLTLLKLLGETD